MMDSCLTVKKSGSMDEDLPVSKCVLMNGFCSVCTDMLSLRN